VLVLAVLLAIGLTTAGLLAVLLVALIRHLKVLTASLRRFQDEVRPALDRIQRDSSNAQERLGRLSEEGLHRKAGARIPGQRGA
jgi:hypothetical protein